MQERVRRSVARIPFASVPLRKQQRSDEDATLNLSEWISAPANPPTVRG